MYLHKENESGNKRVITENNEGITTHDDDILENNCLANCFC